MLHFLLACSCLLAQADKVPDAAQAEQVAALVEKLDARELTERDAAQRKLETLGPSILPLLPAESDDMSAEVAGRLSRLRQALLAVQAAQATSPSLITFQGEDLPLAKVLAVLSEQSGNSITDHREAFGQLAPAYTMSVDFKNAPFWRALDTVLDQADLTLYGFSGEPGLFVINRPPGAQPRSAKAVYSGVFRLEPLRFEAQRDLRNPEQGSLRLLFEVSWEPRLRPFALLQPYVDTEGKTDDGQVLLAASPQAAPETLVRRGASTTELEVPLELPPRTAAAISKLSGKLVAIVPGPLEEFRFAELPIVKKDARPRAVVQRKAGTTVTLESVRANNDLWEANLRIRFEAPSAALESHRGWMLDNQAAFEGIAGGRADFGGLEQTLHGRQEIGLKYLFELPDGPQGSTFVYRTPMVVHEVAVEYEFTDLRLP